MKKNFINYSEETKSKILEVASYKQECYNFIRSSKSKEELDENFLIELKNRYRIISQLDEKNQYDIIVKEKLKYNEDTKNYTTSQENIDNLNSYFEALQKYAKFYTENSYFNVKHISLKQLLMNTEFNDIDVQKFINHITMKSRLTDLYEDFDPASVGHIFDRYDEYEIYLDIKKDIKDFFIQNVSVFDNLAVKYYPNYKNSKNEIDLFFLEEIIERKVLNDYKETLKYLDKAKLSDKYFNYLENAYKKNILCSNIELRNPMSNELEFNKDNKVLSIALNFNQSKKDFLTYISDVYDVVNVNRDSESQSFVKKTSIIPAFNNRMKLKKVLDTKFNDSNLKKNIELFVIHLFIFDLSLLNFSYADIEKLLRNEFAEDIAKSSLIGVEVVPLMTNIDEIYINLGNYIKKLSFETL